MNCHICGKLSNPYAQARVLEKFPVQYFRCTGCGFIQTEDPYWLPQAYARAITVQDTGLVRRNLHLARFTRVVIAFLLREQGPFLDYGGGYGLLVRLLRDRGFDFYRHDPACENLFAAGFDLKDAAHHDFKLVTAYEVFEHLRQPRAEVEQMLQYSGNLLFSTQLLPPGSPQPGEWWYFGPEHGQHISFYTLKALQELAEAFHLNLLSNGAHLHLLSAEKQSPALFRLLVHPKIFVPASLLARRHSLLTEDSHKARKHG